MPDVFQYVLKSNYRKKVELLQNAGQKRKDGWTGKNRMD